MKPYYLAWWVALLPIVTGHLCYLVSAATGALDWCLPYGADCVSISAAGRYPPAYYLFKALMLPTAALMLLYWLLMYRWLQLLKQPKRECRWILVLGVVASVALALYTTMLGADGAPFKLQRRLGVILFFALTAFNHLLLLKLFSDPGFPRLPGGLLKLFQLLTWLLLLLGVSNVPLSMWDGFKRYEDGYEWWFALAMMTQFAIVARLWQLSGFRLEARLR